MNANNYEYRSTFDEVISKIIRATFSVHSVFMSVSDNFTADPLLFAWSAIVRVNYNYWLLLLFGGVFIVSSTLQVNYITLAHGRQLIECYVNIHCVSIKSSPFLFL